VGMCNSQSQYCSELLYASLDGMNNRLKVVRAHERVQLTQPRDEQQLSVGICAQQAGPAALQQ
jgi:hypothetical protein